MTRTLERDLGLYATITVSIGAMVGSGIFVLPGLAAKLTGPSVILSYLLAGALVLPAALSKAEMATAMPEAGGTYLYIDRAMGPLLGTIAGVGAWFSLAFKSAFALVGLGAYVLVLTAVPEGYLVALSLGLGAFLVAVNVVGVKQSGRLQAVVVSLVLLSLVAFVLGGVTNVEAARFEPFTTQGNAGVLAATGFVFVSYAGVTKVASVAEEVENPGRNIPIAMLGSVVAMMLAYTLTVFVVVGVSPGSGLMADDMLTPMAFAAEQFAGRFGRLALAAVAVLALASMANAGVLSSSRFPFAMSRDGLAPDRLGDVHPRFRTPAASVLLTGAVLLALVAFVPVVELAKLASAFKIIIFALVNAALVAFRESALDSYSPEFRSPGYPWVQLFGMLGGLALLTQMGPVAMGGAVGIVVAGVLWYLAYGRDRTEREGAAVDAIRRTATTRAVDATAADPEPEGGVVVAMDEDTSAARERTLLRAAAGVAATTDATVYAVRFEHVPDQLTLSSATDPDESAREFEERTRSMAAELPVTVEPVEVVAHDVKRAVVNYAADVDAALLVGEWRPERFGADMLDADTDWVIEHAPCEVAFVRNEFAGRVDDVAVLTRRSAQGSFKVRVADAVAAANDASLRFVTAVGADAPAGLVEETRAFHEELGALCTAPASSEVVATDDLLTDLPAAVGDADAAVLGVAARSPIREVVAGNTAAELSDRLSCPTLLVTGELPARSSLVHRALRRVTG